MLLSLYFKVPPRWTFASSIYWFLEKATDKENEWIFAQDGDITMTLQELYLDESQAVLKDGRGKFYWLTNSGLYSGDTMEFMNKLIAEGAFDNQPEGI